MSFKFFGVEIPDRVKVVLSFKKEENGFTFVSRLVDEANGFAYMRTNPRPVTETKIDLPWDEVISQEDFVKTFIQMLPVTPEA